MIFFWIMTAVTAQKAKKIKTKTKITPAGNIVTMMWSSKTGWKKSVFKY